jgi:hypothetical protein
MCAGTHCQASSQDSSLQNGFGFLLEAGELDCTQQDTLQPAPSIPHQLLDSLWTSNFSSSDNSAYSMPCLTGTISPQLWRIYCDPCTISSASSPASSHHPPCSIPSTTSFKRNNQDIYGLKILPDTPTSYASNTAHPHLFSCHWTHLVSALA